MRTIVVTGHSSGIGKAITQLLLTSGFTVLGLARTGIANQPDLIQYEIDLSDINSTEKMSKHLASEHKISGIICNAGAGDIGSLENFSASQINASISLNLTSPLVLVRQILPMLKQQPRSDLIFIGSESALKGARYGSLYSAAKFGLRGAAQALREECANSNCHVGIVHPGMVRSDFFNKQDFEPGENDANAISSEDVATAVLSMISAADNAVIEEITLKPLKHVVKKKSREN